MAAVQKNPQTYEHIDPAAGRQPPARPGLRPRRARTSLDKAREFGVDRRLEDPRSQALLAELKELENRGLQFEGADASFELLMQRALNGEQRLFRLIGFRVIDEKRHEDEPPIAEATIMLEGPDGATRAHGGAGQRTRQRPRQRAPQGAREVLPGDRDVRLLDYKVRVLGGDGAPRPVVRVLIESGDDHDRWGTVGVSHNVIEASWQALVDQHRLQALLGREAARAKP